MAYDAITIVKSIVVDAPAFAESPHKRQKFKLESQVLVLQQNFQALRSLGEET